MILVMEALQVLGVVGLTLFAFSVVISKIHQKEESAYISKMTV